MVSEGGGRWIGLDQTVILADDMRVTQDKHGDVGTTGPVSDKLSVLARSVPCGTPWKAPNEAELNRQSLGDWIARQRLSNENSFPLSLSATLSLGT